MMEKFNLPAGNFAFGIVSSALIGYSGDYYPQYLVEHYTATISDDEVIRVEDTTSEMGLKVFQFEISKCNIFLYLE